MSGFPLLLGGKQTFGELPQNDAHDPEPTSTSRQAAQRGDPAGRGVKSHPLRVFELIV